MDAEVGSREELELSRRVARGEAEAFGAFFERYFRRVYAWCARSCSDRARTEALCALVLSEAVSRLGSFRGTDSLAAWVLAIAQRVVADASAERADGPPPLRHSLPLS